MNSRGARLALAFLSIGLVIELAATNQAAAAMGRRYVSCNTAGCCSTKLAECRRQVSLLDAQVIRLKSDLKQCERHQQRLVDKLRNAEHDRDRLQADLTRVSEKLHETRHQLERAYERIESLKEKVANLTADLAKSESNLEAANRELEKTANELTECRDENDRLARELDAANLRIQDLQSRLDRRLAWFWVLALLGLFLVILLLICLWFARYRAWMLHHSIEDARQQRHRDLERIDELGNRFAAAKSRVKSYRRQLEDLHHANVHLHSLKDEYRTYKTIAEQWPRWPRSASMG